MPHLKLRRSALFIPASNTKALKKAFVLEHDVCILDLEASVADSEKSVARANLQELLANQTTQHHQEIVVRINPIHSQHWIEDLKLFDHQQPDAVLLPMVKTVDDILKLDAMLSNQQNIEIWAMIETPQAVLACEQLASLKQKIPRLTCFVFGPNDLALLTRAKQQAGRKPMLSWITHLILSARAYGLDVLDGVYTNLQNLEGFCQECQEGVDLGMDGKTLIHPSQIAECNRIFSPQPEELDFAQAVVKAFLLPENQGQGALAVQGMMVEKLHETMAKNLLAKQELIHAKTSHSTMK